MDARYLLMRSRLSTLTADQLKDIIKDIDSVCFDTFNYNASDNTFCPLAIAHGLHKTVTSPTEIKVQNELARTYSPVNVLKGIEGTFYTTNRKDDLLTLCETLIHEKANQPATNSA